MVALAETAAWAKAGDAPREKTLFNADEHPERVVGPNRRLGLGLLNLGLLELGEPLVGRKLRL